MGGGVALALGASGQARSVCALSPIGFASGAEITYARTVLATTRVLAERLAPVAGTLARRPRLRAAMCAHVVARPRRLPPSEATLWTRVYADAPAFWDLLRDAPSWETPVPTCPTTVAWGERDRLLLYARQTPRARQQLSAAEHVTLPGCGHVPTWDDPEQVARVLLAASR
jgi:pimeloyl-ACP methyl ester carboxylesterase